jgi:hypothetical protein
MRKAKQDLLGKPSECSSITSKKLAYRLPPAWTKKNAPQAKSGPTPTPVTQKSKEKMARKRSNSAIVETTKTGESKHSRNGFRFTHRLVMCCVENSANASDERTAKKLRRSSLLPISLLKCCIAVVQWPWTTRRYVN